jgi:hypothetical protein
MAAARALITMTAQGRGATSDDGIEHLAMLTCKGLVQTPMGSITAYIVLRVREFPRSGLLDAHRSSRRSLARRVRIFTEK